MTLQPSAMLAQVNAAACLFEARWTLRALRRIDPDLHARLRRQQDLWGEVYVTGSPAKVREHGDAMCRGWALAIQAMEAAGEPQDAVLHGFDASTGTRVAIGEQKAAAGVQEPGTVFLTPDDVAVLVGRRENALIGDIMAEFPGAEIVEREPA